jgi:hypothetical protein
MKNEDQVRIETIGEQLRAKINSKFQTSTFLAGFAFTILGLQISLLWQSTKVPRLLFVSVSLMAVAIILFIKAILKLDVLTMPKLFWDEKKGITDSEITKLSYLDYRDVNGLKNIMIFYWTSLTLVATVFTALSLFSMLLPIQPTDISAAPDQPNFLWRTFLSTAGFSFAAYLYTEILDWKAEKKYGTVGSLKD